jgi:hypothetical protein
MAVNEEKEDGRQTKIVLTEDEIRTKAKPKQGNLNPDDLSIGDMMNAQAKQEFINAMKNGKSLSSSIKDIIQPIMEMGVTQQLVRQLPTMFNGTLGGNGNMNGENGNKTRDPEVEEALAFYREQRTKEKRKAEMREMLEELGIDPSTLKNGKKKKSEDDEGELPAWAKPIVEGYQEIKSALMIKEQENAQLEHDNEMQKRIIESVAQTVDEKLKYTNAELQRLSRTQPSGTQSAPTVVDRRKELKEELEFYKVLKNTFESEKPTTETKQEGFTSKDVKEVGGAITGMVRDGIAAYKDLTEKPENQIPSIFDQRPAYTPPQAGITAPTPKTNDIPEDIMQYINNGTDVPNPAGGMRFQDPYGHYVPLAGDERGQFATKERMLYEARANPDVVRSVIATSIDLASQEAQARTENREAAEKQPEPTVPPPKNNGKPEEKKTTSSKKKVNHPTKGKSRERA